MERPNRILMDLSTNIGCEDVDAGELFRYILSLEGELATWKMNAEHRQDEYLRVEKELTQARAQIEELRIQLTASDKAGEIVQAEVKTARREAFKEAHARYVGPPSALEYPSARERFDEWLERMSEEKP